MFKLYPFIEECLSFISLDIRILLTKSRFGNHGLQIKTCGSFKVYKDCVSYVSAILDEIHCMRYLPYLKSVKNKVLPDYFCKYPSLDEFMSYNLGHVRIVLCC